MYLLAVNDTLDDVGVPALSEATSALENATRPCTDVTPDAS
jgi:hypothetical protein